MKYLFFLAAISLSIAAEAQPVVKVELSSDTITIGQTMEVTYTIENGEGNFIMPDMNDLPVVSGPNSSSSFMYQNGKMSSNQSYSFTLLGMEPGKLVVPEAAYKTGNEVLAIHPVEIIVVAGDGQSVSPSKSKETAGSKTTREKRKF
jgi:hypothetical protein